MRWLIAVSLTFAVLGAGCGEQTLGGMTVGTSAEGVSSRPPVIAVIDSGVNPYHEIFRESRETGDWEPQDAHERLQLSRADTFDAAVATDAELWDQLAPRKLYSFAGTSLAAISFLEDQQGPLVLDVVGHGTATASVAAREAPEAVIVLIQVDARLCLESTACLVDLSVVAGLEWAAAQPWIDVISMSFGLPGNLPDAEGLHPEARRFVEASRLAHSSGKAVVISAGNDPSPTIFSYMDGPPWMVVVGGADATSGGETLGASRGVDFAANYTATIATSDSLDGYRVGRGTSVSAPIVSATFARTLALVREAQTGAGACQGSHETSARDLRAGLNVSAIRLSPAAWSPPGEPEEILPPNHSEIDVPVIVAGPQGGWGLITSEVASSAASYVCAGEESGPAADSRADYMRTWHAARTAYWASLDAGL